MTAPPRKPGYSALRKGRVDITGARYFLTIALKRPLPPNSVGLNLQKLEIEVITRSKSIQGWELLSIVVMPDHLHLLVQLVDPPLSESVRRLKGPLAKHLRASNLVWEKSFYDHQIRSDDKVTDVIRYMWLNPYRAGLPDESEHWSGWWCNSQVEQWIGSHDLRTPSPEWWR